VALLNCGLNNETAPRPYDVTYTVKFLNVDGSHVGYDEKGILGLNVFYFIAFFLLMLVHLASAYFLWIKKSLHPIVQVLAITLVLMTVSTLFVLIHWGSYQANGHGCPGCRTFGQLMCGFGSIIFATLLVMIASGWAITYHALPRRWAVLALAVTYTFFFLLFFIISASTATSTASTQIVYSHGALLAFVILYILICWLGVFAYFAYCLFLTFREETQYDKRLFYLIFGIGYGLWFVLPALLNFISIGVDEWFRPRVVDAFQLTASFVGMGALVVLLWPSRVEKYFRIISPDLLSSDPQSI
jgi:hypothetical protein